MKLGYVRFLLVVLGALGLLLFTLGGGFKNVALLYAGMICYVLAVFVWFGLNRCPHCHKRLGSNTGLYCPHCGEKL